MSIVPKVAIVRMDDRPWAAIVHSVGRLALKVVDVGVFAGADAPTEGDLTLARLAAIHEYGAPRAHVPERSFIRRTMTERATELAAMFGEIAKRTLGFGPLNTGGIDPSRALALMGQKMVSAIRATIRAGIPPSLAQATIDRKGSETPLIDTGRLIGGVDYRVVSPDEFPEPTA